MTKDESFDEDSSFDFDADFDLVLIPKSPEELAFLEERQINTHREIEEVDEYKINIKPGARISDTECNKKNSSYHKEIPESAINEEKKILFA